jgi:mRNA interferase MazF
MTEGAGLFAPGSVMIRRADRDSGDGKLRPCVVISSSSRGRNDAMDTVLVVPLTSDTDRKPRLPMPVIAPLPSNGLELHSAAMCGRVSCIRKSKLTQRIGALTPQELRRVRLGVAAVIGLSDLLVNADAPYKEANA